MGAHARVRSHNVAALSQAADCQAHQLSALRNRSLMITILIVIASIAVYGFGAGAMLELGDDER